MFDNLPKNEIYIWLFLSILLLIGIPFVLLSLSEDTIFRKLFLKFAYTFRILYSILGLACA